MAGYRAYLDHNASAPLLGEARAAMLAALQQGANPSSVHAEGRAARAIVDDARRSVASLVNGDPRHVVFTSGATEAASTLLTPDWRRGREALRLSRLYVAASDHPCILSGGRFPEGQVVRIRVGRSGLLDVEELAAELAIHDRGEGLPLIATHAANNETGVMQPLAEIAEISRSCGGVFVVDAVQAAGRVSCDIASGCGDFLILSAHKMGGPAGVGAFVAASALLMPGKLVAGGGQERGHRGGTENLVGIAGFGAAAKVAKARAGDPGGLAAKRDRLEHIIVSLAPEVEIFGRGAPRLPNTVFFSIPGVNAETAQIAFDLAGVALSAGSACSSGRVGPSHVLQAMGFGADRGALRVSIGHETTDAQIGLFEETLRAMVTRRAGKLGRAA